MTRLRTYLDRYPAKMITHLAEKLISKYTRNCTNLLDPFCGSGAILAAGRENGIPVTGLDLNPYAVLLSEVKLAGFSPILAKELCATLISRAKISTKTWPVDWAAKQYWFTEATLTKYERLRHVAREMGLNQTQDGKAVLLAYALSIRRCSRADQRSPKPFISKQAIKKRKGRHFDPGREIPNLLEQLSKLHGKPTGYDGLVTCMDLVDSDNNSGKWGSYSHIITSPPYINAQDYFRNFKLELYLLEGLLPFRVNAVKCRFIGTERGELLVDISKEQIRFHRKLLPHLRSMESTHPRQAAVVHRYFSDMCKSFDAMKTLLNKDGVLVIVCGDNLVGGYSISTWRVLNRLLKARGFSLFDRFGDSIDCRNVPPKRNGHKGLIKQEVISAFVKT